MASRSLVLTYALSLVLLPACGPGKDSGETDTDPTTSSGTATPEPTGSAAEPTIATGEATSTTTQVDTTSTSHETDSSSSSGSTTTEPPLGPCEERLTENDCLATTLGGHNTCAWQTMFAQWSEDSGCGTFAGPPRCLAVHYVGEGCLLPDCPGFTAVFFRELEDGVVELIDYLGCGLDPDGWQPCQGVAGEDPPACACVC